MKTSTPDPDLRRLARRHGIVPEYSAYDGTARQVSDTSLLAVLRARGVDIASPGDAPAVLRERAEVGTAVPPVFVADAEAPFPFVIDHAGQIDAIEIVLTLESGEGVELDRSTTACTPTSTAATRSSLMFPALPVGFHHVAVTYADRQDVCTVVSAPRPVDRNHRQWGLFAPMYALGAAEHPHGTLSDFVESYAKNTP